MLKFPKPTPRPKKKPKALNRKRKFKVNDNAFKTYKAKRTVESTRWYAENAKKSRLDSPTEAEIAFASILHAIGLKEGRDYEREHIIYRDGGSRFVILDFLLSKHRTAFEIDGMVHKRQSLYDQERDLWLGEIGIRTIRFTNTEIEKDPEFIKTTVMEMLDI